MYYLGVDGGGTKTKYILADENGKINYELEKETTHLKQIGKEGLVSQLIEAKEAILSENNISITDIKSAFFGMPGYGEIKNDKEIIDESIEKVFSGVKHQIGNDCEVGWAAGTECRQGVNIVAGTGSIAYGKNKDGINARCGGWGPGIGDDGSAYSIGLKIINEYTKQKDGRHEQTVLVDVLEQEHNIKEYFEIVEIVFDRINFSRTEIAKFASLGSKAAELGCNASRKIFEEAGVELAKHIVSLKDQLGFDDGFIVSYTGGVFKADDLILEPFKKYLIEKEIKCEVRKPTLEPWEGAVLLAKGIE